MQSASFVDGLTAIGYTSDVPDPSIPLDTITIPDKHRLHAMILGSSGYGKSTILKLLIRQNLIRGEGVAILDPHHDLAAWCAQRIPRWRANHLIYISPAQLLRTHKAIPINPLESYGGAPGIAATTFAETLLKAFESKGPRMEQLLIQAATSLIASNRGGLGLLRRIIIDKSERDAVLANVHLQDNLDFWERIFPNLAKEAVPAVDNKLTPIISNPAIGPFFEGDTGFDMQKLIDGNGILIFDGAGCNNDGERTIFTTFLLNMITTAASKLAQARPQGVTPKPFYLYVDEMQLLESDKLKEMLQQVRKWGIKMTLATQQLESIDPGNAAAMLGNCDLYITSRCTQNTAKMVAPKMGIDAAELTQIPKFHMTYHMGIPSGDIHGRLMRTRQIDNGTVSWDVLDDIVDWSMHNYGIDVDMDKYTNSPQNTYDISPLDMAVLSILYHNPKGFAIDDIHVHLERYGPDKRRIVQLLGHMIRQGMIISMSGIYCIQPAGIDKYFDVAALKGRAGGDLHISTISSLQNHYSRYGYYTSMDTGDTTDPKPDLEVCEPAIGPEGAPDMTRWGRRVSIEVETGPSRHPNKPGAPGQVYKNWSKSHGVMDVWFLVYNEHDMGVVHSQLRDMGVTPEQYMVSVISAQRVIDGTAIPMPPGFAPAEPLPCCEPQNRLEAYILSIMQDGMSIQEVRRMVPSTYTDKEVRDMIDQLITNGTLNKKGKRLWWYNVS